MCAPRTPNCQTMALLPFQLHKRLKIHHHHHHHFDIRSKIYSKIFPYNLPSSDLSDDILDHIFYFLPIKHAIRLGILNTMLKNSWLFNPIFYFGRDFASCRSRDETVEIISRIFIVHCGLLIRYFHLYIDPVNLDSKIDCWTRVTISKGIEELDLDFSNGSERFKLSTDFIHIVTLKILKLSYCQVLEFPVKLNGLSLLRILTLRRVNIAKKSIFNVFHTCLNLEVLDLAQCDKIHELEIMTEKLKKFKVLKVGECLNIFEIHINSPTLISFHYYGHAQGIYFTSTTPQLRDVMINFIPVQGFVQHYHTRNLVLNLDCVEVLTTNSTFLEGLSSHYVGGELREVEFNLSNVKELQIFMENSSYCNPYDITSFVNKCPKIEKIFIDLGSFNFECGHYWEVHLKKKFMESIPLFNHLKMIKVKSFKFQKHVLELASYFLKGAVSLETLALVTPTTFYAQDAKTYEQFLYYWRVSPIAKIFITDHTNDLCFTHAKHPKSWY